MSRLVSSLRKYGRRSFVARLSVADLCKDREKKSTLKRNF